MEEERNIPLESMSKEQLIRRIRELNEYMSNVVVFWGGKKEFRETFEEVSRNENEQYTDQEAANARIILEEEGAFEEFLRLVRESFERGGINYVLSEKISTLMEEVAGRYAK